MDVIQIYRTSLKWDIKVERAFAVPYCNILETCFRRRPYTCIIKKNM